MRFEAIFVLLFSLICVSKGAPPEEVGQMSNFGVLYTKEEDQFIVDELQNILEYQTIKPQSRHLWYKMAKKYYEKRIQGATGFVHERSAESLRHRFTEVLVFNKPNITVKVPEALIKTFVDSIAIRNPYTREENNFIIMELSKPSYTHIFSQSTYEALRANHAIIRAAKIPGFEHERSAGSIRNHLVSMKNAGRFPKEIQGKIKPYRRGASSSRPTTSNQQTDMQETNEEQRDDNWIADMIEGLRKNTDFEIDFSKLE